jgi:hypothetical protein
MPTTMSVTDYFPDKPRYRFMLPMSYMVPTFLPTAPGDVGPRGNAPAVSLDDRDLQSRAQRLVNVLYWTADTFKDLDGMNDPDTLKVFIAPEFYFRKASPDEIDDLGFASSTSFGSYPEYSRYALAEALYGVIQRSSLFKDWIIVAGTICSVLPRLPGERMNLLNTAIMLRGQRDSMDSSVPYMLMEKHYISHIDGPPKTLHANLDPTTTYSFRLNPKPDRYLDNLVYWDGMSVGLEVCLDHSEQVLKNAMNLMGQVLGPKADELDLQLVTSCGMDICNQAVAVRDGALVMLTDGMSSPKGYYEPEFQLGRYDANTGQTTLFDPDSFTFEVLPEEEDYQLLDYGQGRYVGRGRRQGVWAGKEKFPL